MAHGLHLEMAQEEIEEATQTVAQKSVVITLRQIQVLRYCTAIVVAIFLSGWYAGHAFTNLEDRVAAIERLLPPPKGVTVTLPACDATCVRYEFHSK